MKELSFLQWGFSTLIAFYLSCFIIITSIFLFDSLINTNGIILTIQAAALLSMIMCIFFSPSFLLVVISNFMINHKIKYLISFIIMEFYGFFLFIILPIFLQKTHKNNSEFIDGIIWYFGISLSPTILFLFFLRALEKFFLEYWINDAINK